MHLKIIANVVCLIQQLSPVYTINNVKIGVIVNSKLFTNNVSQNNIMPVIFDTMDQN